MSHDPELLRAAVETLAVTNPRGLWRHKKSGVRYRAWIAGLLEATCEPHVVYWTTDDKDDAALKLSPPVANWEMSRLPWIRPLPEFLEKFEPVKT